MRQFAAEKEFVIPAKNSEDSDLHRNGKLGNPADYSE